MDKLLGFIRVHESSMTMRSRIAVSSFATAMALWPGWVFAAEAEPAGGSWFALIFYVINFLLFLWVVRKYGWPRIIQFFHERSRTIRDIRGRAEKAHQEAQELAQRAAEQLARLEADKHQLKAELDEETAYQLRRMNEAAHEAESRIRRDTEVTRLGLREAAQRRLRRIMAQAAGRIARELVHRNFQPSDQARLLSSFVDRMDEESRP
jgi:F-type H+-transporting ATPase subunit b